MKTNIFLLLIFLGLTSCSDINEPGFFVTSPVSEDYSSIENPKERWGAYKLKNYAIDESWACECIPPSACTAYIVNNTVVDVKYELPKNSYYGRSEREIYSQTKNAAMTVEEAFGLLEKYRPTAHQTSVEYHRRLGYPTRIFIDKDSLIADEEISLRFSNLQRISRH